MMTKRVSKVAVIASHSGDPRRRSIAVNGCTPMTSTSASRTGETIDEICCRASVETSSPVHARITTRPRGIDVPPGVASEGSV